MKRMAIAAASAMLAAGSATAQIPSKQEIFCAELRRVVEVAELGGDFAYLERSRAAPPRLGFAHGCQATGNEKKQYWVCGQSFAPEELSRDALAARVADCLPDAARGPGSLARDAVFSLPYARIYISELGGPRAHVGRIVEMVVEAVDASRIRSSSRQEGGDSIELADGRGQGGGLEAELAEDHPVGGGPAAGMEGDPLLDRGIGLAR